MDDRSRRGFGPQPGAGSLRAPRLAGAPAPGSGLRPPPPRPLVRTLSYIGANAVVIITIIVVIIVTVVIIVAWLKRYSAQGSRLRPVDSLLIAGAWLLLPRPSRPLLLAAAEGPARGKRALEGWLELSFGGGDNGARYSMAS